MGKTDNFYETRLNKRGQLAIFIIVAIAIVVVGILIFLFYPQIQTSLGIEPQNPQDFLQNCLEEELEKNVDLVSSQGGSVNPENVYLYKDDKIEYLCYTSEYYEPCVVQQPLLKKHIESEIKDEIKSEVESCFSSMKDSFERRGYSVEINRGDYDVELLPKRIVATFSDEVSLSKGESVESYDELRVVLNNNLYELTSIALSIIGWEARYGDAETTSYMNLYRDLKVEKLKQSDGTTIYILTDRNNEKSFQFASRSFAWPPGYGGELI